MISRRVTHWLDIDGTFVRRDGQSIVILAGDVEVFIDPSLFPALRAAMEPQTPRV